VQLKNKTRYPTARLRAIARTALATCSVRGALEKVHVTFRSTTKSTVRFTYYRVSKVSHGRLTFSLPERDLSVTRLYAWLRYGFYLTAGVTPRDLPPGVKTQAELASSPEGEILQPEPEPPKPEPSEEDRKIDSETKALRKLEVLKLREKSWQTKQRRAETALAKIRKQRAYYERVLKQRQELLNAAAARATW